MGVGQTWVLAGPSQTSQFTIQHDQNLWSQVLHSYEKASCWQDALLRLEAIPYPATAVTFGTVRRGMGFVVGGWGSLMKILLSNYLPQTGDFP